MNEKDSLEKKLRPERESAHDQNSMDEREWETEPQSRYQGQKNICHSEMRYAGFWMRFWAYLVDLIIIASIGRLLVNPIFRLFDISLSSSSYSIAKFAPITIISAIIYYGYFVIMTRVFKQTLGKMIFGLKVVPVKEEELTWGAILFREWIGRFISTTTWVGYVIVAFLPKKQGLHDLFSDTTVIHER